MAKAGGVGKDTLTTDEIARALGGCSLTAPLFVGVFALDQLPARRIGQRPSLLVINTAYSKSGGEHWVGVFLGRRSLSYFDSYGLPPRGEHLMRFISLNNINDNFTFNTKPLQSLNSSTCGKFATTYLVFRALGFSTKTYVDKFSKDADRDVRALYKKIFGVGGVCARGGQRCYKYGGLCT